MPASFTMYVLDGRAGKISIPPDDVLHVNKSKKNLAPLRCSDSEDTKNRLKKDISLESKMTPPK